MSVSGLTGLNRPISFGLTLIVRKIKRDVFVRDGNGPRGTSDIAASTTIRVERDGNRTTGRQRRRQRRGPM